MTRALHRQVGRIEQALGLDVGHRGEAGGEVEPGLGDPLELVPVMLSEEAKALLRACWEGAPWAEEATAKLDAPSLVPRILAEGDRTARGRRHGERIRRALDELLVTRGAAAPWEGDDPPPLGVRPPAYGLQMTEGAG